MGTSYNPAIVTDGLVLCLDAASKRSYPGTGTTWTDRSVNGYGGTLTNTDDSNFSDNNRGVINLDATNEYLKIAGPKPTTNISISSWIYPLSSNNGTWHKVLAFPYHATSWTNPYISYQIGVYRYNVPTSRLHAAFNVDTTWWNNVVYDTDTVVFNRWYYLVATFDSGVMKLYVDGVLKNTNDASSRGTSILYHSSNRTDLMLGTNSEYFVAESFNGGIANVSIYNKTLTVDEIRQNYEATVGRFS